MCSGGDREQELPPPGRGRTPRPGARGAGCRAGARPSRPAGTCAAGMGQACASAGRGSRDAVGAEDGHVALAQPRHALGVEPGEAGAVGIPRPELGPSCVAPGRHQEDVARARPPPLATRTRRPARRARRRRRAPASSSRGGGGGRAARPARRCRRQPVRSSSAGRRGWSRRSPGTRSTSGRRRRRGRARRRATPPCRGRRRRRSRRRPAAPATASASPARSMWCWAGVGLSTAGATGSGRPQETTRAVAHQGRGRRGALGGQEVERAALVVVAPPSPLPGRLEQLGHPFRRDPAAHVGRRSRSSIRLPSTPGAYSISSTSSPSGSRQVHTPTMPARRAVCTGDTKGIPRAERSS